MDQINQKNLTYDDLRDLVLELQGKVSTLEQAQEQVSVPQTNVDSDNLFDTFWKQIFYWNGFFDDISNYDSSGASLNGPGNGITLTTGGTSGNSAFIEKFLLWNSNLKYSTKIYFRTTFDLATIANCTVYIIIGNNGSAPGEYFGFKITGGSIYACSNDGTTEKLQLIGALTKNINTVEARFYPSSKVTYYLNPTTTMPGGVASINVNIPIASETIVSNLFQIIITTNTNAARTISISNMEILQGKNYTN